MSKAKLGDLYSIRINREIEKTFKKIAKMTDIKKAFVLLIELMGKCLSEKCEAKKYSEKTGGIIETHWIPNKNWDGIIYFPDWLHALPAAICFHEKDPLYQKMLKKFDNKPIVFMHNNETFVVEMWPHTHKCFIFAKAKVL